MAAETFVVDDFLGGEFGDLGPSGAAPAQFSGLNVMVYQDGSIGPRPGMMEIAPTGVPTGAVWGFLGTGRTTTRGILFGIGNTVYGFTYSPLGAVGSIGTLSGGTPTVAPVKMVQYGSALAYLVSYGDKGYKIDPVAPAVTAHANFPGGRVCGVYTVRMIAANTATNPNRVYFTAVQPTPGDFTSWPALNYFDVGAAWPVQHVEEARSRLAIANSGNEWWSLSGAPGVNSTLRRAPRADVSPYAPHHVARIGETLWFLPGNMDFPAQFTGAVTDKLRLRYLAFTDSAGAAGSTFGACSFQPSETLIFTNATTARMLVMQNGVWTVHSIPAGIGPYVTALSDGGVGVTEGAVLLCDGGAGGVAPRFYVWKPTIDRPGKVGDAEAQPGDASTTPLAAEFELPERWARDGREITVRSVAVDFVKWNTGASVPNHIGLTVRNLYRAGVAAHKDSGAREWSEPGSATPADKTLDRHVFTFGEQGSAHGFQLRLSDLVGVGIRRITIHAESSEPRGRP